MRNNVKYGKPFKAECVFLPIIIEVVSKIYYSISLLFNLWFFVPFLVLNIFKVYICNNCSLFRVFKTAHYYKVNVLK